MILALIMLHLIGAVISAFALRCLDQTLPTEAQGGWKYIIPSSFIWELTILYVYGGAALNHFTKKILDK